MSDSLQPDPLVELAARLAQRAEAVEDPARRADLLCRLGLLCWDVLEDFEAAAKYLTDAGTTGPDAVDLRLHLALQRRDREALATLVREVAVAAAKGMDLGLFWRTCADAWLFFFHETEPAARAARDGLRRNPKDAVLRAQLTLSLELAGAYDELARHLRTATREDIASTERLLAVLVERLDQCEEAAKILRRLRRERPDDLYSLEWLCDLLVSGRVSASDRLRLETLLEARLALLEDDTLAGERAATAFRLAQMLLGPDAKNARGLECLAAVTEEADDWAGVLLWTERRVAALRRGDSAALATAYGELARRTTHAALRTVYRRRRAEVLEAAGDSEGALDTYLAILSDQPGHVAALRAAERLLIQSERWSDLVDLYETAARHDAAHRPAFLERAGRVAEACLEDISEALRIWRPAVEGAFQLQRLGDLSRVLREGRDRNALRRLYVRAAAALEEQGDPRRAALYAAGAGVLALALDDADGSERQLGQAIALDPQDVFAHTALVGLYRREGKWRELVGAIERELAFEGSDTERARLHAEIGRIAVDHLKDLGLAKQHLQRATEMRPEDPSLFHLLARVHDLQRNYAESVALRQRAVEGFGASYRAAVLLCEIGEIYARHLRDDAAAEAAFREALERDDEMDAALDALAALYRRKGRYEDVVSVLERRLELAEGDPELEMELHLSVAGLAERNLRDSALALAHYRRALEISPESEAALHGVERICRRGRKWETLVDILTPVAQVPAARGLLREAYTALERWEALRDLLVADLAEARDPAERAATATALGELLAERLGDVRGALRYLAEAVTANPTDRAALEAYARLGEEAGAREAVIEASERLLQVLDDADPERVRVAKRLAGLRLEIGEGVAEAARALEAVLPAAPEDDSLLSLLAEAYAALDRPEDRLTVLYRRAETASDVGTRVEVLLQAADIHAALGESDVAAQTLLRAFRLDPSNRDTFTRAEQRCYEMKRWKEVMELYDVALTLVESGQSRAYRLADLYARRGQLQLQYLSQPGEAAASYLKVLDLDPENDTALKFLEAIFSKEGDWEGLIRAYEQRATALRDPTKRVETLRRAARVAAAKLKDAQEAARHYEAIFALAPQDGEALDALERYYEHARNWQGLVTILEARLAEAQNDAEIVPLRMRLAALHEEGLRDVDAAVENYQHVLERAPDHREALDALGRIYEATERWAEFIDITRRQIRITQDRTAKALLYFKCGSVMEAKFGKSEDAIRYYEAAIKTSPGCLPAVHGLRDLHLREENWPKVLSTLELEVKLWQESKERAGVFARMGRIYQEHLGNLEKAVHYFESALSVDPECMPAIRALFDVAFAQEDWEEAARLSKNLSPKALREGEPAERSDLFYKRGLVAEYTRDAEEAAENLVTALELRPENLPALDALIRVCRAAPDVYDYASTFRELEKVYQRRAWPEAQARVLVAQALLLEQRLDVDGALALYEQAAEQAPDTFEVVRPLVDLYLHLRRVDDGLARLSAFVERVTPGEEAWQEALLYRAEIESVFLGDSRQAAATLRVLLKQKPRHREALYRHAQELVMQERWADARTVCERLIEVAADPKRTAPPVELGRYYYYLGHVCRMGGDGRAAASAFRRALDLAPGQPRAAIALAQQHAGRGNVPQAEALLTEAVQIAIGQGRTADALQLRRALAGILHRSGNRAAAVAEWQAVVGSGDGTAEDHVALATLFAEEPATRDRAIELLRAGIALQPDFVPAIHALGALWPESDPAGKLRPLRCLRLLGAASQRELAELGSLEKQVQPPQGILTDELRAKHLATEETRGPLGQLWQAIHPQVERLFPLQFEPRGLHEWESLAPAPLDLAALMRRLSIDPASVRVFVAEESRIPAFVAPGDPPVVVLWRPLLEGALSERVYLVARCLESVRTGVGLLYRLGLRERAELGLLLKALVRPKEARDPSAEEFLGLLSRKQQKAVERVANAAGDLIEASDPERWMRSVLSVVARAGLLLSDDVIAAMRVEALLARVEQAVQAEGKVALRAIPGGQNLLRFYLSNHYYAVSEALGASVDDESRAV